MSDGDPASESDAERRALDGLLRAELGGAAGRRRPLTAGPVRRPPPARRARPWAVLAAAAIVVLIGAGAWLRWDVQRPADEPDAVAETATTQVPLVVDDDGQTTLTVGTRTTVRVDGPARIVRDGNSLKLRRGTIDVSVTPGSELVRIGTPAGPVEVLGTRFRVQSWHGQTLVETWEGRVRFGDGQQLAAGQAARAFGTAVGPVVTGNPYGDSQGELWHPDVATILASKRFVLEARPHGADRPWWRSTQADPSHWRHPPTAAPGFTDGRCTIRLRAGQRLTVDLPPLPSAVVVQARAVIREGTADLVLGHLGAISLTAKELKQLPQPTDDVRTGREPGQRLASQSALLMVGRQTRNGRSHPIWELEQQVDGAPGRTWTVGPLDEVGLAARTDCLVEDVEFTISTLRLDEAPP